MKGVSEIIVIVTILLIGITLTALLYLWITQTTFNIYPEEEQEAVHMRERACLGISAIGKTSIIINNCGKVPLSNFKIYVEGELAEPTIFIQDDTILPGEAYKISIKKQIEDNDKIYVTSDYANSPVVTYSIVPVCGNYIVEGNEECDMTEFAGETCETLVGPDYGGSLTCSADCKNISTSGCVPPVYVCKGGSCDATTIENGISQALPGANVIIMDPWSTYDEGRIDIEKNGITLDCNGSTLQAPGSGDRLRAITIKSNTERVTIKNCIISGYEVEGIEIKHDCIYNIIKNNKIQNSPNGITVEGIANNNTIDSNRFYNIGNCAIENCQVTTCQSGEPNPGTTCINTIINNTPTNCCNA